MHLDKSHVSCEMPYRCRVCYYQASSHSMLIDHFYKTHAASSHLLCPMCLDTFPIKGDNQVKGLETGHLQYLTHLNSHMEPTSGTCHRCKKCTLTFLQYEQLRFHVRTDHGTCENHSCTRPFSFAVCRTTPTVAKPVVITVDAGAAKPPPAAAIIQPTVITQTAPSVPSPSARVPAPVRPVITATSSVSISPKASPSTLAPASGLIDSRSKDISVFGAKSANRPYHVKVTKTYLVYCIPKRYLRFNFYIEKNDNNQRYF